MINKLFVRDDDNNAAAVAGLEACQVAAHLLPGDRQSERSTDLDDPGQGATGVLKRLTKQGLGQLMVAADALVEGRGIAGAHGSAGEGYPPDPMQEWCLPASHDRVVEFSGS